MFDTTRTLFGTGPLLGTGLALTLLSGCLGTENPDFNQQALDGLAFVNQLETLPETQPEDLPTGTVAYDGVVSLTYDAPLSNSNPGTDLFADMTLTADFDTNDIAGEITSFNSPQGNVAGTVDVTDGAIAGSLMQANAIGTVVDGDNSIDLDLDVAGQFRGTTGTAITGVISGTYTPEGGSEGDVFGSFGVEAD